MANFKGLMDRLAELEQVPSQCATLAAGKIAKLVDEEFARGADPYGDAWAPLAPATLARGRRPPPLTDTGALRYSITVKASQGAGIEIEIGVPYATFIQTGTGYMPARTVLPAGNELPQEWEEAIESSLSEVMRKRR